jgi:hypothetical protein
MAGRVANARRREQENQNHAVRWSHLKTVL